MNRLRELRKKNNISADELAEILNITVRHLYDLESGKVSLGDDRIKFLCNKFGVSADYLLGRSDDPELPEITDPVTLKELEEVQKMMEEVSDRLNKLMEKHAIKQDNGPV